MRKTINPQPNLREPWLELEHARELETISSLLDAHPKLNELVLQDLRSVTPPAGSDVGRGGMSAEQVLRALLVKQLNQFTYRELAFHLADSRSYRTFCQLGIIEPTPSKSTLAANIKAVKFETLEQINRELVSVAEDAGIEKGRKVRVDCTVVESNIHPPTDSELLYDCVRVLTRVMCRARELLGTVVVFGNRTRRAKRRRLGVLNAKDKQQRRRVYRDRFSCRFGGSDLCWRAWPMDAAAIVENAGNSGRERRLGKGCEHVQTWSGVFHNRLENASRFPRAPTGPS